MNLPLLQRLLYLLQLLLQSVLLFKPSFPSWVSCVALENVTPGMPEETLTTARVQTDDGEDILVVQVPYTFVSTPEESSHTWLMYESRWKFPFVLAAQMPSGDWILAGDKKFKEFVEQRPFASLDWRPTKISYTEE